MSAEFKMMPAIQWVQPAPVQSLIFRNPSDVTEEFRLSRMAAFDELFPAKKHSYDRLEKANPRGTTEDTFHRAITPLLIVGQFFGVLPISGIRSRHPTKLRFSWCSPSVMFTLVCLGASASMTISSISYMFYTGVDIYKTTSSMFYGSSFMTLVIFLKLAPQWPLLTMTISRKEKSRPNQRSLRSKFRVYFFAIMFPAMIEHLLAVFSGVAMAGNCNDDTNLTEQYFKSSYQHVFYFTNYSLFKGIVLQFINLESTFNWNFMDLFVIVISICLVNRFDLLNEKLEAVKGKHLSEQFWKMAREEFSHLSRLVKEVDSHINEIVLLSFANNLYFICLQLFQTLNNLHNNHGTCSGTLLGPVKGISHSIYFMFSFGFMMTRALMVSLKAAQIHTAAQEPATTLYAAPSSSYNAELHRFLDQVVTDKIALTGLNFFYVTKGLVLTIAGTIVTYELVLVQFNSAPPSVTANITIGDRCGIPIKT